VVSPHNIAFLFSQTTLIPGNTKEHNHNFHNLQKEQTNMNTTLYQRLGGATGIAKLVDDVMAAHMTNPLVKSRFENIKDMDRGKDMLAAHKGMNISEQEYLAAMDDIVGAMHKNGSSDDTKKDVIAILYSLKGNIIRV
jgi:hemoglobin